MKRQYEFRFKTAGATPVIGGDDEVKRFEGWKNQMKLAVDNKGTYSKERLMMEELKYTGNGKFVEWAHYMNVFSGYSLIKETQKRIDEKLKNKIYQNAKKEKDRKFNEEEIFLKKYFSKNPEAKKIVGERALESLKFINKSGEKKNTLDLCTTETLRKIAIKNADNKARRDYAKENRLFDEMNNFL